jgi:type IV secretory pathway TraG/TraD family ATPase VirD4
MLDMSIRYGLTSETRTNYVLDEIDELPALSRLSTLASAGREEGVRALIGIQTKCQLEATYGSKASAIYGNCPQGIYFSPGDPETTDYMLEELGERRERVTTRTTGRSGSGTDRQFSSSRSSREVDRTPITSGELRQFDSGECVVVNRTEWWISRVAQLNDVRDEL